MPTVVEYSLLRRTVTSLHEVVQRDGEILRLYHEREASYHAALEVARERESALWRALRDLHQATEHLHDGCPCQPAPNDTNCALHHALREAKALLDALDAEAQHAEETP